MEFFKSQTEMLDSIQSIPAINGIDASKLRGYTNIITSEKDSSAINYVKPSLAVKHPETMDKRSKTSTMVEEKGTEQGEPLSDGEEEGYFVHGPTITPESSTLSKSADVNVEKSGQLVSEGKGSKETIPSQQQPETPKKERVKSVTPTPPPKKEEMKPFKAKAIFDFVPVEKSELAFKEDDILMVIKKRGEWWVATSLDGKKEGLVPSNFLEPLE